MSVMPITGTLQLLCCFGNSDIRCSESHWHLFSGTLVHYGVDSYWLFCPELDDRSQEMVSWAWKCHSVNSSSPQQIMKSFFEILIQQVLLAGHTCNALQLIKEYGLELLNLENALWYDFCCELALYKYRLIDLLIHVKYLLSKWMRRLFNSCDFTL